MRTIVIDDVRWLFRPNIVYTAEYRGFNITIRYRPLKPHWRLFVSRGGGSITFKRQFHETAAEARSFGIAAVDLKLDKDQMPYA